MYSSHNYTGPGWNNSTPPPVNASNLQDISNALEDLNITQEQLEQLGASGTLGDILTGNKLYQYCWKKIPCHLDLTVQTSSSVDCAFDRTSGGGNMFVYDDIIPGPYNNFIGANATQVYTNTSNPSGAGSDNGKYILSPSYPDYCFKILGNAKWSERRSGTYYIYSVSPTTQYRVTYVSDGEAEYLFSDNIDEYPKNQYQNGSYYQYIGCPYENSKNQTKIIRIANSGIRTYNIPPETKSMEIGIYDRNTSNIQTASIVPYYTTFNETSYIESQPSYIQFAWDSESFDTLINVHYLICHF